MKIAKLSLVAAVAVAGLTSANASSLEQAIKGVDVSGMVRYRFDQQKTEKVPGHTQTDNYKAELQAVVPVNDLVKATVKVEVDGAGLNSRKDSTSGNANPTVDLTEAYFTFNKAGYTVMAGKQGLPGPQTDGLNGTGVVAMATPLKSVPVTLAAAYYNASDVDLSELNDTLSTNFVEGAGSGADIYAVAAIGSFQGVNAQAWLADVREIERGYALLVDGTVGPVTLGASYASKELDAFKDLKFSTLKVTADAKFGMFDVNAGYAKSGKNGTGELWNGNDAKVNDFGGKQLNITKVTDGKLFKLGAGVSPIANVKLGLAGVFGEDGADMKHTEVYGTAAYSMSKNFTVSTYYSNYTKKPKAGDKVKTNKGRLEVKYTF